MQKYNQIKQRYYKTLCHLVRPVYNIRKTPGLLGFNTLRPRQDGRLFPDDIFKSIFFNENVQILIKISPTFIPKAPINNFSALVRIMTWCRPGDKPLSEPMMVSLLTHICVTRPQWVNSESLESVTGFHDWQSPECNPVKSSEYISMSTRTLPDIVCDVGFNHLCLSKDKTRIYKCYNTI